MPKLIVTLNGTSQNPWHRYNLTCNPFPQIGRAEFDALERRVALLDGDPIKDEADLRERLEGFTDEFVHACVTMFRPGERVRFEVSFPD